MSKKANETRLIDANALMYAFRKYMAERFDSERCVSEENCMVCDRVCLWRRIVKDAPTVDAVEVVHGTWLDWHGNPVSPDEFYRWWRCSECKYQYVFYEAVKREHFPSNYCPNCGAKMDGDGNG